MFIGDISHGVYKAIYNVWGAPPCEDLSIPQIFGISSAAGEYKQHIWLCVNISASLRSTDGQVMC